MKPNKQENETLQGVVREYNFSPKGGVEGMLLQEGERLVQVNFPPEMGMVVAWAVAAGSRVEATIEPDAGTDKHPPGDHPVYRLVSLKEVNGPPFDVESLDENAPAHVDGVVRRLNYANYGEANGVVLDSGDFVHLKPDGMKRAGLSVGQRVAADGKARPMVMGGRVIEADAVNGIHLEKKNPHH